MGSNSVWLLSLGKENLDVYTSRGNIMWMPCENEGKDLESCVSKLTPKIANQLGETRGEAWNHLALTTLITNQALTLDF